MADTTGQKEQEYFTIRVGGNYNDKYSGMETVERVTTRFKDVIQSADEKVWNWDKVANAMQASTDYSNWNRSINIDNWHDKLYEKMLQVMKDYVNGKKKFNFNEEESKTFISFIYEFGKDKETGNLLKLSLLALQKLKDYGLKRIRDENVEEKPDNETLVNDEVESEGFQKVIENKPTKENTDMTEVEKLNARIAELEREGQQKDEQIMLMGEYMVRLVLSFKATERTAEKMRGFLNNIDRTAEKKQNSKTFGNGKERLKIELDPGEIEGETAKAGTALDEKKKEVEVIEKYIHETLKKGIIV